jgi:hypothetical protein
VRSRRGGTSTRGGASYLYLNYIRLRA